MTINICTINLNVGDGRQTIYWDSDDHLLHTSYDGSVAWDAELDTLSDAQETAMQLYANSPEWDAEFYDDSPIWYALMTGPDDDDWGTGTYDRDEAIARLRDMRSDYPDAYIAVIQEGTDTVCIDEIRDI